MRLESSSCVPGPSAPSVPCETCKKLDGEVNHPTGMIYVGWGHGWQPCPVCGGSGVVAVGKGARCSE